MRTCGRTLRQQQAARSTTTTITSHRHQCPSRMPPSPSFYLRGRNANRARFRSICIPSRGGNLGARRGLQLAGRRIWRRDRFRPDYSRSARAARRRQVPPGRLRLSHYLRASRFGQGACCVLGRAQQLRLTPFASLTKPGRHVYFLPAAGDHGGHGPALPVHGAADEPAHAPPVDLRGGALCHLQRGLSKAL